MAKRVDVSGYEHFSDVTDRLDEIVKAVRDKDTSLEHSLDLFDEAIALGSRAVDLVDKGEFSDEERAEMTAAPEGGQPAEAAAAEAAPAEPVSQG